MIFKLLNNFWAQNRISTFSPNAAFMYFYIVGESNARRWQNPVPIATKAIERDLDFSRKTITNVRRELQERGLIEYNEGARHTCPAYLIHGIPTVCHDDQNDLQNDPEKGVKNKAKKGVEKGSKTDPENGRENAVLVFPTETLNDNPVFPTETLTPDSVFPTETLNNEKKEPKNGLVFPLVFPTETLTPILFNKTINIYTPLTPLRGEVGGVGGDEKKSFLSENENKKTSRKKTAKNRPKNTPKIDPKIAPKTEHGKPPKNDPKIEGGKGAAADPISEFDATIASMKASGAAKEAMLMTLRIHEIELDEWIDKFRNEMVATANTRLNNARQYFISWCRRRMNAPAASQTQQPQYGTNNYRRDPEAEFAERKRREAEFIQRLLTEPDEPSSPLPF